ncbi:uncharacterized protein CHSO_1143 [Chryseobacterium sp. StRB126]|nr:uncharacterized protein CHSO_1143 [Chryseobacterium sp. StRB126]
MHEKLELCFSVAILKQEKIKKIIMDNKTLSIVSYITIIGWLIAFISGKDKTDSLLRYHLKQSLGVVILSFILSTILGILISVTHLGILGIIAVLPLVLMIIGAINAANEVEKPLPLIGKMIEDKFSFIS